jgi:uncharacterized protein
MSEIPRPMPVATDATRPFWDAAGDHRLLIQQCESCGKPQFFPRAFCRHCLSEDPRWKECGGAGAIYTFTVNYRAANGHMADQTPYVVAIVTLDEGVRMMTNIVDSALEDIRIGARVAVRWLDTPGQPTLPQFKVVAA